MGKTKQILDFYGLPGAGKSTICNNILITDEAKAANAKEIMTLYQKESLLYKVTHIPILALIDLFVFLFTAPHKGNGKQDYIEFIYLVFSYHYFARQDKYKLMVVDHGLIQQLGSFLHNNQFEISVFSLNRFISLLSRLNLLTAIYCSITEEDALSRMRERGRTSGRIDAIMDNADESIDLLKKERRLFQKLNEIITIPYITLDMSKSKKVLLNEILQRFL